MKTLNLLQSYGLHKLLLTLHSPSIELLSLITPKQLYDVSMPNQFVALAASTIGDRWCHASSGARTGWRFPCMQISPSIATEAFQAAALSPVIGGPVYRTVAKRNGRQSTFVHVQGAHSTREAKLQTTIVHYRNCEGRLHPVTAHPRKVTYNQ